MTDVHLHIFEDSDTLGDLKTQMSLPIERIAAGVTYRFDWHSEWHTFVGTNKRMNSKTNYAAAADYLRTMQRPAILFFDLHMLDSGRAVDFDPALITDELLDWLRALHPSVRNRDTAVETIKKDLSGLLLALIAASNPKWEGVIVFASNNASLRLDDIRRCTHDKCRGRVVWLNAERSMSASDVNRAQAVQVAIDEFLSPREGPKIWNERTPDWFKGDDRTAPAHDAHPNVPSQVALIREYLESLLLSDKHPGRRLPDSWFGAPAYNVVFESLKGLVGDQSACEGDASRNLRVGALPLLMAAHMSHKQASIDWFLKYEWQDGDGAYMDEILSHKTQDTARQAVLRLGEFLFEIGTNDEGDPTVRDVGWTKLPGDPQKHLYIDLDFDPLARGQASQRSLLQAFYGIPWTVRRGDVMQAYADLIDAAVGVEQAQLRLLFSCYPVEVADNERPQRQRVTRLDFRKLG